MTGTRVHKSPANNGGFAPDVAGRGYVGKFRAKVTDNLDPLGKARLRVKAKDVLEDNELGWALASVPYAGDGVGFFFIPPVGADVWVEFEQGNPDYPIWSGCFWSDDLMGGTSPPASPPLAMMKVLKTDFVTITIQDIAGGALTIETKAGMKIVMDQTGVSISTPSTSVALTPISVSVNKGSLEVLP